MLRLRQVEHVVGMAADWNESDPLQRVGIYHGNSVLSPETDRQFSGWKTDNRIRECPDLSDAQNLARHVIDSQQTIVLVTAYPCSTIRCQRQASGQRATLQPNFPHMAECSRVERDYV